MKIKRTTTKTAANQAAGEAPYCAPSEYEWNGVMLRMPASPLTPDHSSGEEGIPRLIPEAEYREKALASVRAFHDLADRVERMDPTLKPFECVWIAGAVRAYASQIYLREPRTGQRPKIDPLSTVMRYIVLRRDKRLGKMEAIAELEDEIGVSDRAIKDVLKKYEEQVRELEEAFFIPKRKQAQK